MSILLGIAIARTKRGNMEELQFANISIQDGIIGDRRGNSIKRQISILFDEDWIATCNELNKKLHWTNRRANLFVSGLQAINCQGKYISIGGVVLRVNCETDPCEIMNQQYKGLMKALTPKWRGGICCSVIKAGNISIKDKVYLS